MNVRDDHQTTEVETAKGADILQSMWMWFLFLHLSMSLLLAGWQPAAAQQGKGYQITNRRIVVNSPAQWRNWSLPTHAVELTPTGSVKPRLFRGRYNILDDSDTFKRRLLELKRGRDDTAILNIDSTETLDMRGNVLTEKVRGEEVPIYTYFVRLGISRVGSNPQAAANILDGDPATYWEPDPNNPLDTWWIEVDLGRVVPVDELVLRFVDADLGDPFRQFRILAAPNQAPVLQDDDDVAFEVVGSTRAPNRDQRTFQFPLEQFRADPKWTGKLVETIRIVVTSTRAGRSTQISAAEWEALDGAERGDIVYFTKDQEGLEEPVSQTVYESLSSQRQGHQEFYLRERPRLADIEVWGFGDNISPGILEGGGNLALTGGGFSPGPAFDGDFTTNLLHSVRLPPPTIDRGVLTVDMRATFWLDALRISATRPRPVIEGYIIRGSDGSRDANGQLKWHRLSSLEREDNTKDGFEHLVEGFASPPKLRYLEIVHLTPDPFGFRCASCTGPNIAEYQIFSRGYPAAVVLESDLIELPVARNFGRITWEVEKPPGTNLEIRTRTGDLLSKIVRYYDKSGSEITEKSWSNLLGLFKGPIDTTFTLGSGWSPWSRSYTESGEQVTSPIQRKFLQVQVKMLTEDRLAAASIRSIDIELLDPLAERLLAELWPLEVAVPGRRETFEVFIQPFFGESSTSSSGSGFDELLLSLPASSSMELLELSLGVEGGTDRAIQVFRPSADEVFEDASGERLEVLRNRADSIWVRLPAAVHNLPAAESFRIYHRIAAEGDQVPIGEDGQLLTEASHGLLEAEERGAVHYFRKELDATSPVQLTEVDQLGYDALATDEREARYFRILAEGGAQFPFDASGDSLDLTAYNRLPSSQRGRIVGPGPLLKARFTAPVFLNGTTLKIAVRTSAAGPDAAAWQNVEPGDATPMVPGDALSINIPLDSKILDDFAIAPNPFTPNGDGVNDQTEIRFAVFKIGIVRQLRVQIYALDGRPVWQTTQQVLSGQQTVLWLGVDSGGRKVVPGIYICQLMLDVDSNDSRSHTLSRLISVAY